MNALILAAGYGTRLYPLTRNVPKPLLPIGGRALLDYLISELETLPHLSTIYLVSNHRFVQHFRDWTAARPTRAPLEVLDDGTNCEEERLGAIGDIAWSIREAHIAGPLLVAASDNLLPFRLVDFVTFAKEKGTDCVTCHRRRGLQRLRRTAIIERAPDGRVLRCEEKPRQPWSDLAVPPIYWYLPETLPLFEEYLAAGNNPDSPGHFLPWLIARRPVHAFLFEGDVLDIGTLESYQEACKRFAPDTS